MQLAKFTKLHPLRGVRHKTGKGHTTNVQKERQKTLKIKKGSTGKKIVNKKEENMKGKQKM